MLIDYQLENYEPIQYRGNDIPIQAIQCKSDEVAVEDGCYLDLELANKRIDWHEKTLKFYPYKWQRDLLLRYYGWRKPDGSYRYSTLSIWIPKKQGKSLLISALIGQKLFELENCNFYSVAYNSKQASILLDGVISLFRNSPKIQQLIKAKKIKTFSSPARREINNLIRHCKYVALADNINANDGLIGSVFVADEIHRMKNKLYEVCAGMTTNIPGSLEIIISTAGDGDRTHISFKKHQYASRVLAGEVIDTSILPVIYEFKDQKTRDKNVVFSLDSLLTCNPVLVEKEENRIEAERELIEAKELNNLDWWRRFKLNVWCVEDGDTYIDADKWRALTVDPMTAEQLKDCDTYIGLDMARCVDLTAITLWHELPDGRIYQQEIAILPADRLLDASQKDDVDYCKFADNGELRVCDGKTISDEYLADMLVKFSKQYKIIGVGFDQYFADYVAKKMQEAGIPIVQCQQSNNRQQTVGINYLEELVIDQRICHAGSELYEWELSCCRKIITSKQNYKLVKKGSNIYGRGGQGRIDNIDAAINAALVFRHHMVEGDALEPFVY